MTRDLPVSPTSGQPLRAEDVGLLVNGDLLMRNSHVCRHVGVNEDEDGPHGLTGVRLYDDSFFHNLAIREFTFIGRPDPEGWMPWSGGENPVPGLEVIVRYRCGTTDTATSGRGGASDWSHDGDSHDIIAFRLVSAEPDRAEGGEGLADYRERVAQWLCEEIDWPDPIIGRSWPLHENDSGHRGGGGYVKLQPIDIVERFREIAKRLPLYAHPSTLAGAVEAARKALKPTDEAILAAATAIRESSVAWANDPEDFAHLIELTPPEVRQLLAALAPTAGEGV